MNKGVSACATCDGALYRGQGDGRRSAAATPRWRRPSSSRATPPRVTVVHRRDELRASKIMAGASASSNEKIEFAWNSVVEEVLGDEFVTGARIRNVETGEVSELPVEAFFVAIGHTPNTELLKGQLELDDTGYIKVDSGSSRTGVEGVFACGDAMDPTYRQAITAAGTGCMAAIDAERWLAEQGIE